MNRVLSQVVRGSKSIKKSQELQRWKSIFRANIFHDPISFFSKCLICWTLISNNNVQFFSRCLSTQAKTKSVDERKTKSAPAQAHNHSFVHNLFRGQVEHSQVFPFPIALDQEQIEYVGAFIDPVTKFFLEVNDASRNDANAVSLKAFAVLKCFNIYFRRKSIKTLWARSGNLELLGYKSRLNMVASLWITLSMADWPKSSECTILDWEFVLVLINPSDLR